jgi:acetyltransferase-like isoleucine patch superfamily enzyme
MRLALETEVHHLDGIFSDNPGRVSLNLKILGKPLLLYNIEKLVSIYGQIERIMISSELSDAIQFVEKNFPLIHVEETQDISSPIDGDTVKIPLNSVVIGSSIGNYTIAPLVYPWDVLDVTNQILRNEVTVSNISKESSIAKSAVIEDPCIIEDGVSIDDFCKIKGPVYIGADTKIGTSNLIRNSMIGRECKIGFANEIAKSYLAGTDTVPHLDVVLDSIIGQNVWMGAYVGFTNVMLNNQNVRYEMDQKLVDTGLQHFGSVVEHDSTIGAGVILLPGRHVPSRYVVPPGIIFSAAEKNGLGKVLIRS